MVPLWVLARRWGVQTGALAGGTYGLAQLLLGATIAHPLQALLDYGLAFVGQGLAGWRRLPWVGAAALAGLGRLVAHSAAAPYFLGRPLLEILPGAVAYNLAFLVPDWLLALLLWRALLQARPGLDNFLQNADDLI
jgi:thiamine transporter